MRPQLVMMTKAPVIGGAKTRLARHIGKVSAWRLYRAMVAKLVRRLKDRRWDFILAVAPQSALQRRFPCVWPIGMARIGQGGGDLGARQAKLFSRFGPVCVIGSDAPQVRRSDIALAFKRLKTHDIVIGPAFDGGYWLIAANAPLPQSVFEGVRWSHASTLSDLEGKLRAAGLDRIWHLRTLQDVDEAGDVEGAFKEARS